MEIRLMNSVGERLNEWLRDAHAAEQQAETMLSNMASRVEDYPELKRRIEQHVGETRRQAERVRGCLERRGDDTSALKDTGGKMLGFSQAMSGMLTDDEVMKGAIASSAFEAMEIASYRILADTAAEAGDPETARVCQEILREEQAMAAWLERHLPSLTHAYLVKDRTPGARL
jgi:ferritin-like metal-binding protein YciE